MSKRKKDEDKINVGNNSGNVGYSQKALAALDTGSYGTITNRKPKATTSSSQITITKTIPVLNGATSSTTISTSPTATNVSTYTSAQPVSVTKNSSRTDTSISTTRARQNYSQNHKPIGRSLTKKDSDIVYNAALKMLNNNMTAQEAAEEMRSGRSQTASGMTQAYVKNKNWEKEYGKSLETLIEEFVKDDKSIQRKSQEIGERGGKVGKTAGSVYMNAYLKPVTGAKATISNLINPNSEKAKNADKMARAVSDVSKSARESTTRDMGTVGKTVYNLGTSAADRLAGRVFGDAGHALTAFRTAEDTRESLQDRGITGRGAEAQALAAGAIDAALDIKGLDSIKGLKGLQQSGNLAKSIIGSAAIGGGEQAATSIINEAIDRIANKDKSNYAVNVQNYMAQGMSQKDAKDKAWSDEINTVLQEAGMGALVGTAMGTGGQVARKAANTLVDAATGRHIPSLWTPTKSQEPVIGNAIKQSQDAAAEIERLANEIPKLTEEIAPERIIEDTNNAVNPENVVYHSGKLSRLNKAETRGKMSEGSRDTGYYGTGHYFVDSAHKTELDNGSGYGNKPYSSVDISKYDNLYRAATDQQASDLHDFSQKYTRYANKYNDKYYTDSDGNIDKTARAEYLSDLYNQFQRLFPEQTTSLEDFVTKLERYRNSENNVDISDRGDSVFTQFMKDMGYNGVDTRGTRSADTSRGVVIYDLDEDSVLQSNVTDADAKKGLMNNYVRNEGQPVFDADEDARIQNILDTQKRNADIQNAYRNLYDDTALRSAETDIEGIQNEIDNLEKTARPHYEALLNDPDYLEREVNRQVRDFNTMGLEATEEETRSIIVDGAKESLAEIDTRLERLRQQLGETQAVINEETIKSKAALDQARASIENRVAAEKAEPNPILTEKVDDITNHPRYVKPLEGEELNNANATIEQNTREINTIQQRIDAINKNPKNKKNGKLTKKAADEVKTLNAQKRVLNAENTALKKQIKGGITPVKDLLSDDAKKSLFGKFDSVYSDLYVAKKIAGETEQAKQLEKDARKHLGNYIESGNINDLKMFYGSAAELQELAERTGGKYVTKSGEYSYNDWFGTGTNKYTGETENLRLLDSVDNRIPYKELESLNKTNIAAESAPVDRITENIEPPVTETPVDNVPPTNDEGIIPPNDGGNVPPIPPETPRMDEIPTSGETGQSRVVTNTGINSDIISQKDYDTNPIYKELASYAKHNNEVTYDSAMQNVRKEGTALLDDYINGKRKIDNDLDVDQAMILLTNMSSQLKTQGEDAQSDLLSQRNLLFSRLREAGTQYGQLIQAFKKWNNTAEGAIINGESMLNESTKKWKSRNKKAVQLNSRIAKALENMGVDSSMRNRETQPKTREEIKAGVIKVLEREYGSVEGLFNDNDIEFLTTLAEDKRIPVWQITDEIEHRLNFGEWYELDNSEEPKLPQNQRLKNALNALIEREPEPEKEPLTPEQIREQVRNTINNEFASFNSDFTDEDINYLSNLIQNGATKAELTEALNTKLATGLFGISENTQKWVNRLFEKANQYDPDSKDAVEARSEAYALIANEVVGDASLLEKFEAWRYLAMLGNPKTMVRNWVGNKLFGVVTGASNNLAAALEAGTDKIVRARRGEGIQRTKTFLSPSKDRELINACANDGDAHRYSEISGTKYEKGTKDAIRQQKSVFNNKLIQLYEKATDKGISDYNAVKSKYSTSLAGYLKANGYDKSIFDADNTYRELKEISRRRLLTDAEQMQMENARQSYETLEKARDYAVKEAEYATFHEDNAVAQLLSKHSQDFRNSDNAAARALGYMIEGIVPFKKTPANILRSGIEYSPLNLAKSLVHTARLAYENTGSRKGNLEDTYTKKSAISGKEKEITKLTASEVLDDWAKTVTGTGLVGLGMYLANNGVLNLSNKDEKYQDDLEGIQNYSLKIGDKTYTLDWAAPAVMPLLVGAEISNINKRNGLLSKKAYENLDEIVGTVNALLDPIFETSMMQGVKNTLESAANEVRYNDDGAMGGILGSMATNTLTGYLTQGLPTLSGQIARTVDPTRRATDVATSQNFLGSIEKQGRKLMNKIPGLSYANEAYRDAYGRTQQNSPFDNVLGNLGYQMLSPSYIRDIDTTAADKSAREAYYALGEPNEEGKQLPIMDKNVFATWKGKVTESGHKFTPEEMGVYRKSSGEAQYRIRDALAKAPWFNELSGTRQNEILKKVNTLVDKIGKEAAGYPQDDDDLSVYKNGGIPSLLDKYHDKQIKKQIEQTTGVKANSKVGEELLDAIKSGNKQAIDQATAKANKYAKEKQAEEKQIAADEQKIVDSIGTKAKTAEDLGIESKTYVKIGNKAGKNAEKVYNAIPSLKRNGLGSSSAYYTYADALSVDPNLSTADFIKTFNTIDADNSKGIKQDELISYFNSNNVSQDQANKYWKMYGDSEWKKIPKLEGGKYKKVAK